MSPRKAKAARKPRRDAAPSGETPISRAAYARTRNVSPQAVYKAIAAGRLVRCLVHEKGRAHPRVVPSVADQEWAANAARPPKADGGDAATAQPNGHGAHDAHDPEPDQPLLPGMEEERSAEPGTEGNGSAAAAARQSYQEHRAQREAVEARMAELRWRERAGELVEADRVRAAAMVLGISVRDAVFAALDRLAPLVGGLDPTSARQRMREEVGAALAALESPAELEDVAPERP